MRPPRRSPRPVEDLRNVTDQPAKAIFFSGLLIALIFGLAIRGLLHPAKIKHMMEGAAARIHPELRVSFAQAHVELSSGGIPGLAVVIEQVVMESDQVCWMRPRLSADVIRLPVSLGAWFRGESVFKVIRVGKVDLRIDSDRPSDCSLDRDGVPAPAAAAPVESAPTEGTGVHIVRRAQAPEPLRQSGEIERVEFEQLDVSWAGSRTGRAVAKNFLFLVRSTSPRVYQLRTTLAEVSVPPWETWDAPVQLQGQYTEFPENFLELRLSGHVREGSYSVRVGSDLRESRLSVAAEARHLPLRNLMELAKTMDPNVEVLRPRQSWVSGKLDWSGSTHDWQKTPFRVSHLQMEGDLGEVIASQVDFLGLQPLRWAPVTIQIQNMDLDNMFRSLDRPHPSPVFSRLGRFRGVAEFQDPNNFRLIGEQSGMEFVFSNKGRREMQTIQRMQGDLRRKAGAWTVSVDRIELDQGVYSGEIGASASADLRDVELRVRSDGFTLSPTVQRLMTRDGSLGRLQGQIDVKLRDGKIRNVKGRVQIPEMLMEGLSFEGLQVALETAGEEVVVSPKADRLRIEPESPAMQILGSVLPASWRTTDGKVGFSGAQGQFRLKDFSKMRWTSFSAKATPANSRLQSKGGWDQDGILQGDLQIQSNEGVRSWKLQGTRDAPILSPGRSSH